MANVVTPFVSGWLGDAIGRRHVPLCITPPRPTLLIYLGICFIGIILRAIGGSVGNFSLLILGRIFEGQLRARNVC